MVARTDGAIVEDDGAELPVNETIKAVAAATSRAATTTTVLTSQRSERGRAGPSSGARAGISRDAGAGPWGRAGGGELAGGGKTRTSSRRGVMSTGVVEDCAFGDGSGRRGGAPADSRARRTALSMAPRAR